jgi:tetratricopeptide (TPR) repeat protein
MADLTIPQAMSQAMQWHRQGHIAEAEAVYRQVLQFSPNHPDALHLLGLAAHQTGRQQQALELLQRAVRAAPNAGAWNNLGEVLRVLGRDAQAADCYLKSIELAADDPQPYSNLGNVLRLLGDVAGAADACEHALTLDPRHAAAWTNLGNARASQQRWTDAIQCYDNALRFDPAMVEAHCARGIALHSIARYAEALASFEAAVRLRPDYAEAQARRAIPLLTQGDLTNGFAALEWRRQIPAFAATAPRFDQPVWDGADLRGRTLLLYAEEGFGDTIQWARYAQILAARGERVVIQCQPELASVLAHIPGVRQIVPRDAPLPDFDLFLPMGSLPLVMGTTSLDLIPGNVPYLSADPNDVADWQRRLGPPGRPLRVGLAWTGNPANPSNEARSVPIDQLAPFAASPDVEFHSLQKLPAGAPPPPSWIKNWSPQLSTFAQTAALMACLDLVITVETAVAHLAGALARPTCLMLADPPDWRWLLDRADSPWYPTMQLFRQPRAGDWAPVISSVVVRLVELTTARRS